MNTAADLACILLIFNKELTNLKYVELLSAFRT